MRSPSSRPSRIRSAALAALLALSPAAASQEAATGEAASSFPRRALDDVRYLALRPFGEDPSPRRRLAVLTGAAAALYLAREELRDRVQDTRSEDRTRVLDAARSQGKGAVAPLLAVGFGLAGLGRDGAYERETAEILLESAAFSAALAAAGSYILAAERPEVGTSVHSFRSEGRGMSLDAALAASIVVPIHRRHLRIRPYDGPGARFGKRALTGLLYGGAILTGLQRMDQDKHWAPDVFLGLSIGFGVGSALCDAREERHARRAVSWSVAPARAGGLVLVWSVPLPAPGTPRRDFR
jgi:hypothetical protein